MIAEKWDYRTHKYKLYVTPIGWYCPLLFGEDDLDQTINCAGCGLELPAGDCYTSKTIHNPIGLGFNVCEDCYIKEGQEEKRYATTNAKR